MPAQSSAGGGDIPAQSSAGRGYKPVQSFAGGGYRTAQSSADNGYRPALQGPGLVGRRQIRATQACNHCRLRKQRCDEARPCQLCRDNALDCQYKEVPMPKQDVKMMQLQNSVNGISDTLNGFIHRWEMATETRQPLTNSHDVMATAKDHPAPPERFRSSRSRTVGQHPGAIQSDHNTSAHKLLPQWSLAFKLEETVPALKHLVDSGENFIEYPLYYERKRGNLRVWGFGQGDDIFDFIGSLDNLDSNSGPPSPKVPIATGFKYGCPPVNHSSSSTMNGDIPRNQESVGLGSDGKADFRLSTLNSLRKSYQKHIHILHPILDLNELEDMIDSFGKTYGPNAKASYTMSYDRDSVAHKLSRGSIERSIGNAIVLLVLALGTVSEHKGNLPSPIESSSYSEAYDTHSRNIDILPGFIYFAHATDILGHQQSGNTVAHVQAMILAALYLAQLGRVMESWNWISNACRATLVLLHAYYPRINRQMKDQQIDGRPVIPEKDPHQLNILSIVYWSCLSLETDILAEWSKLPASMVSTYQGDVKSPWAVFEHAFHIPATTDDDPPGTALSIFSNLADLRVLLNGAHNDLYKPLGEESTAAILKKSDSLTQLLREWRNALDPSLAWNDEDPPSTDVNTARLRAKMYGAKYVILRPYLYETIKKYENLYTFKEQMQHPELIEASKDCILSAIQSTIAFDRVGADPASPYENYVSTRTRRLILTNVVGTLHAQFGNMVVLAAAWISPLMNHLPRGTLDNEAMSLLFYRTMNILSEMAPNSPILQVDYDILSEIKHQLQLKSYQS
ncbi:hypothetical protein K505DRAFT_244525 [Melanomma pulvis-pyrius CBS 109.77]|uniref:Zn(2)-C6 fungal-type domain-containing protein n=1 Tax=Melanomma pulvis-pyrius CBS 109.77 TaxID=1314802 RepID=A0A6A6XB50_9PLEO|nr:hypothetical protein K505DRAFT_244525 [Melanomma pulvis-pyrius CBS 109.77]